MHILIVTHYFPPLNAIASLRPLSFVKYFTQNGIDVTVLTTQKNNSEGSLDLEGYSHPRLNIIEVPYQPLAFWRKPQVASTQSIDKIETVSRKPSMLVKVLTGLRKWGTSSLGSIVDYQFFWTGKALEEFDRLHKKNPVDVMISTFSPPAAHFIAWKVKRKYPRIKWVADYRDLWSNNHIMAAKGIFHNIEQITERTVIAKADYITTVSEPLALDLAQLFKNKIPVSVVYNGYDGSLDRAIVGATKKLNFPIQIVYTGTIYKGRRDPSSLFLALNELEKEGVIKEGDIRIDFYGTHTGNLEEIVKQCSATKWANIKGYISYAKSLEIQTQADFLLHLESNDVDARGVVTGKLFEYMITGNTILAIGVDMNCASAQVIEKSGTGVVFGTDQHLIKEFLRKVCLERVIPSRSPNIEVIASFARSEQAKNMLSIIEKMRQ